MRGRGRAPGGVEVALDGLAAALGAGFCGHIVLVHTRRDGGGALLCPGVSAHDTLYGALQGLGSGQAAALASVHQVGHVLVQAFVVLVGLRVQFGVGLLDTVQGLVIAHLLNRAGHDHGVTLLSRDSAELGVLAADLGHQLRRALGVALGQQVVVLLLHGHEVVLDLREDVVGLGHLLTGAALRQLGLQLLAARALFFQQLFVPVQRDELALACLRRAGVFLVALAVGCFLRSVS